MARSVQAQMMAANVRSMGLLYHPDRAIRMTSTIDSALRPPYLGVGSHDEPRLADHRGVLRPAARASPGGSSSAARTPPTTTSSPAATWAGSSSAPRSSRRTSAPSTSSASPAPARPSGVALAHYELHAWCLLVLGWVFIPFYMRSSVFTMPEFLERRFSPASRWVLSLISLVAYVITKIAVGIFAGGVVFGTLLPELAARDRRHRLQQLLDRIGPRGRPRPASTRSLGGMRAVAYTEARADDHPDRRLAAADRVRPRRARRLGRAAARARLRDVQPVEAAGAGRRRGHVGAGEGAGPHRAGTSTPTIPGSACCSARRSSASGTGAPISTSSSARSGRRTRRRRGAGRSSPRS